MILEGGNKMEESGKSNLIQIATLILLLVGAIITWNHVDHEEALISAQSERFSADFSTINASLNSANTRLVVLQRSVKEVWMSDLKAGEALLMLQGRSVNCSLSDNQVSVTNAFFDKLPYAPGGYLTYTLGNGWVVYEKNASVNCYDLNEQLVDCTVMCNAQPGGNKDGKETAEFASN